MWKVYIDPSIETAKQNVAVIFFERTPKNTITDTISSVQEQARGECAHQLLSETMEVRMWRRSVTNEA
jgi:hypothetical protein